MFFGECILILGDVNASHVLAHLSDPCGKGAVPVLA